VPSAQRHRSDDSDPVVVIGAGLAGCALVNALAEAGRSTLLVERGAGVAGEASGNVAGLFHGVVHGADGRHARFHRAAAFAAHDAVARARLRHGVLGSSDGLLRIEPDAGADASSLQSLIDRLGLPDDYVRALPAEAASMLAGVRLAAPAWYYPHGGWVDPRALARSWLADAGTAVSLRPGCAVDALRRVGDRWLLLDASSNPIATATTVVLCNASGVFDRSGRLPWPVRRQRGQVSSVAVGDMSPGSAPSLPITGSGYVLPAIDGRIWFGATTQWDDDEAAVRDRDHRENVERWHRLVAAAGMPLLERMSGRTSWRWVSEDRLPIIGAVPAAAVESLGTNLAESRSFRLDQPRFVARAPGLFVCAALGSRGIASASLGARLLAAAITGAPSMVEADLLDAVDPARFLSRQFRRGESARNREAASGAQPPEAGSLGAV
jgi:tRNA 5-methylaminomethyl-2-thiouridine biosynthesis bifunctional protein